MQSAFEYEINKYDQIGIVKSDVIFYWLNVALDQYVETKYSNSKESFEETQKVTDELSRLVKEVSLPATNYTFRENSYSVTLPDNYLHALTEEVDLVIGSATKRMGVVDSSSATITSQLKDPYSEHILHYGGAKPLRLFNENSVILITDGNYTVSKYVLRYLRNPSRIVLSGTTEDYSDLPLNVHEELVRLAALLFIRSVGVPPNQQENNNNNDNIKKQ